MLTANDLEKERKGVEEMQANAKAIVRGLVQNYQNWIVYGGDCPKGEGLLLLKKRQLIDSIEEIYYQIVKQNRKTMF